MERIKHDCIAVEQVKDVGAQGFLLNPTGEGVWLEERMDPVGQLFAQLVLKMGGWLL